MRKLKLEELGRISPHAFKAQSSTDIVVILDNIRSAHNVGAFFRTCDGLGIGHVILTGITAQPPHPEIHKSAIGAQDSISWTYISEVVHACRALKDSGYKLIGIEQTDSSILLHEIVESFEQKLALIFGNEVMGITDEVLLLLDESVEIPQFGTKHSFNVSVCGGIVLWEYVKRWKELQP